MNLRMPVARLKTPPTAAAMLVPANLLPVLTVETFGCSRSEACGIDEARVSTHSLRKSFVRSVYDASGRDLIQTQRVVGRSSPVITARYLESTQSELDELVLGLGPAARAGAPALALAS